MIGESKNRGSALAMPRLTNPGYTQGEGGGEDAPHITTPSRGLPMNPCTEESIEFHGIPAYEPTFFTKKGSQETDMSCSFVPPWPDLAP